jgi:DNA-binding MarR family transcriptional regulator
MSDKKGEAMIVRIIRMDGLSDEVPKLRAKPAKPGPRPAAKKLRARAVSKPPAAILDELRRERAGNLRQLLLGAHRALNRRIAKGLNQLGYDHVRPMHLALYSNIDFDGTKISDLSERAGMTVQGMGQIVTELESLGYVSRTIHESDRRVRMVHLTDAGWKLMLDSIESLRNIESEYEDMLKPGALGNLRSALRVMAEN